MQLRLRLAATDPDPAPRNLVGDGLPRLLGPLAGEAEEFHPMLRPSV